MLAHEEAQIEFDKGANAFYAKDFEKAYRQTIRITRI